MQKWGFKTVLRLIAIVGVLAGMLTILGCPSEEEVQVAASDITVPINRTTVQALEDTTFTLPPGAFSRTPALANQQTTVKFTKTTTATPITTITAPNGTVTGTTTFRSCDITVTASTVPGVSVGQVVTADPCNYLAKIAGQQANGQATVVQILLALGLSASNVATATAVVNPDGSVTVNGIGAGSVTVTITGAAGG